MSIDYSIGILIDILVETSTDYSIGISINALGQALMRGLNMLSKLPRQLSPTLAILAQLGWIHGEMQAIAYVYKS